MLPYRGLNFMNLIGKDNNVLLNGTDEFLPLGERKID
jgi:hypothetical protein